MQTVEGGRPYGAAASLKDARSVAFLSRLPWEGFVRGSERAETRARDDIWLEEERFRTLASELYPRAATLVKAAETGSLQQLKVAVVAQTVNSIYGAETDQHYNEALARALGLDMRRWSSYFDHVSKARILDVVTEAVDANAASPLAALKKDAVVSGAEQTLAGVGSPPAYLKCRTLGAAANQESPATERAELATA